MSSAGPQQRASSAKEDSVDFYSCSFCDMLSTDRCQVKVHYVLHHYRSTSTTTTLSLSGGSADISTLAPTCPLCHKKLERDHRKVKAHLDVCESKSLPNIFLSSAVKKETSIPSLSNILLSPAVKKETSIPDRILSLRSSPYYTILKCVICDYRHTAGAQVRKHGVLTHFKRIPVFSCVYCPFAVADRTLFDCHLEKKHPSREVDLCFDHRALTLLNKFLFLTTTVNRITRDELVRFISLLEVNFTQSQKLWESSDDGTSDSTDEAQCPATDVPQHQSKAESVEKSRCTGWQVDRLRVDMNKISEIISSLTNQPSCRQLPYSQIEELLDEKEKSKSKEVSSTGIPMGSPQFDNQSQGIDSSAGEQKEASSSADIRASETKMESTGTTEASQKVGDQEEKDPDAEQTAEKEDTEVKNIDKDEDDLKSKLEEQEDKAEPVKRGRKRRNRKTQLHTLMQESDRFAINANTGRYNFRQRKRVVVEDSDGSSEDDSLASPTKRRAKTEIPDVKKLDVKILPKTDKPAASKDSSNVSSKSPLAPCTTNRTSSSDLSSVAKQNTVLVKVQSSQSQVPVSTQSVTSGVAPAVAQPVKSHAYLLVNGQLLPVIQPQQMAPATNIPLASAHSLSVGLSQGAATTSLPPPIMQLSSAQKQQPMRLVTNPLQSGSIMLNMGLPAQQATILPTLLQPQQLLLQPAVQPVQLVQQSPIIVQGVQSSMPVLMQPQPTAVVNSQGNVLGQDPLQSILKQQLPLRTAAVGDVSQVPGVTSDVSGSSENSEQKACLPKPIVIEPKDDAIKGSSAASVAQTTSTVSSSVCADAENPSRKDQPPEPIVIEPSDEQSVVGSTPAEEPAKADSAMDAEVKNAVDVFSLDCFVCRNCYIIYMDENQMLKHVVEDDLHQSVTEEACQAVQKSLGKYVVLLKMTVLWNKKLASLEVKDKGPVWDLPVYRCSCCHLMHLLESFIKTHIKMQHPNQVVQCMRESFLSPTGLRVICGRGWSSGLWPYSGPQPIWSSAFYKSIEQERAEQRMKQLHGQHKGSLYLPVIRKVSLADLEEITKGNNGIIALVRERTPMSYLDSLLSMGFGGDIRSELQEGDSIDIDVLGIKCTSQQQGQPTVLRTQKHPATAELLHTPTNVMPTTAAAAAAPTPGAVQPLQLAQCLVAGQPLQVVQPSMAGVLPASIATTPLATVQAPTTFSSATSSNKTKLAIQSYGCLRCTFRHKDSVVVQQHIAHNHIAHVYRCQSCSFTDINSIKMFAHISACHPQAATNSFITVPHPPISSLISTYYELEKDPPPDTTTNIATREELVETQQRLSVEPVVETTRSSDVQQVEPDSSCDVVAESNPGTDILAPNILSCLSEEEMVDRSGDMGSGPLLQSYSVDSYLGNNDSSHSGSLGERHTGEDCQGVSENLTGEAFACRLCAYSCDTERQVKRHLGSHHISPTMYPFRCNSCRYEAPCTLRLAQHIQHKHQKFGKKNPPKLARELMTDKVMWPKIMPDESKYERFKQELDCLYRNCVEKC